MYYRNDNQAKAMADKMAKELKKESDLDMAEMVLKRVLIGSVYVLGIFVVSSTIMYIFNI